MSSRAAFALAPLLLPVPALAQSQTFDIRPYAERVTGEALRGAFEGVTHDGAYNFTERGQAQRTYSELHKGDGTVAYSEDGRTHAGEWAVRGDTICYSYPDMNGGCFRVWRVRNCYYYYSDRIPETSDEIDRDYWTARSVRQGEGATCEALFM